jgi:hypothetical protein
MLHSFEALSSSFLCPRVKFFRSLKFAQKIADKIFLADSTFFVKVGQLKKDKSQYHAFNEQNISRYTFKLSKQAYAGKLRWLIAIKRQVFKS